MKSVYALVLRPVCVLRFLSHDLIPTLYSPCCEFPFPPAYIGDGCNIQFFSGQSVSYRE